MNERWDISAPEHGDGDDTVLVQFDGSETIRINEGTLAQRKRLAQRLADLLNEGGATLE